SLGRRDGRYPRPARRSHCERGGSARLPAALSASPRRPGTPRGEVAGAAAAGLGGESAGDEEWRSGGVEEWRVGPGARLGFFVSSTPLFLRSTPAPAPPQPFPEAPLALLAC